MLSVCMKQGIAYANTLFVLIFARTNFRAISRKRWKLREIARKLVPKTARKEEVREKRFYNFLFLVYLFLVFKAKFKVFSLGCAIINTRENNVNGRCAKINPRENKFFFARSGCAKINTREN